MAEFIVVRFVTRRPVIINGGPNGFTDDVLRLPTGPHTITLHPGNDISPSFRRPTVAGTTRNTPMEILFSPLGPVVAKMARKSAREAAAAGTSKSREKSRKKRSKAGKKIR